jgi:hypothetical protein
MMRSRFRLLLVSAFILLTWAISMDNYACAQADESALSDSTRADSLRSEINSETLPPDSTHELTFQKSWLLPLGVILTTGTAILILFSVRSR